MEANPSSREAADWRGLREAGVNRISLGAQSLRDAELRALARGHSAAEVRAAVRAGRAAGFDNLSLDLIYGIPGQSLADWGVSAPGRGLAAGAPVPVCAAAGPGARRVGRAAAAGGAPVARRMAARQDDGLAAAQYNLAQEELDRSRVPALRTVIVGSAGLRVSPQRRLLGARPYTGIGAGAHSYDGVDRRSWNGRDLDRYLADVEAGRLPSRRRELDPPVAWFEAIAWACAESRG